MKNTACYFRFFVEILAIIALVELAVMFLLPVLAPGAHGTEKALLDSALLTCAAGPLLLWRLRAATSRAAQVGKGYAAATDSSAKSVSRFTIATTTGVLMFGLGCTLFGVWRLHDSTHATDKIRFERQAERLKTEVQHRLRSYRYGLRGTAGLYSASESVERGEFRAYTASRDFPAEFPGAQGLGFVQRVPRRELEMFTAAQRIDEAPDFAVRTLGDRPELYVVTFIEPLEPYQEIVGLDFASDPMRRESFEMAMLTGEPTLSSKFTLAQNEQHHSAFLYILPVYRNGTYPTTPEERQRDLVGWIYMPLVVEQALAGVTEAAEGRLDLEVYDGTEMTSTALLYDEDGVAHSAIDAPPTEALETRMFHERSTVNMGGREWTLWFGTTSVFDAMHDSATPIWAGFAGAFISILVALVVFIMGTGRVRALALAQAITEELASAKDRAEAALREAEALRHTIDKHSIVSIADPRGRIIDVNEALCRISGYSRSELLGQDHRLLNSGHHPKAFWAGMWKTIAGGNAWHGEVCNRAKDGSLYWVDSITAPFKGPDGDIEKYVSIRADITERKLAERALSQFKYTLDQTLDCVFMFRVDDFRFVYVNEGAKRQVGYSEDELLGMTPLNIKPEFTLERFRELVQPLLDGTESIQAFETVHRHKDGHDIPVEIHLQHVHQKTTPGGDARFVAIVRDITERKRSLQKLSDNELRFRTLVESADVIVWESDPIRNAYTYVSPQARRMGYPLEQWLEPDFRRKVMHPGDRSAIEAQSDEQTKLGLDHRQQFRLLKSDGSVAWVENVVTMSRSADGLYTLRGVMVDITSQKAMESALIESRNAAQAANRAKSEFLANMSHEIRTPLTAILGFADLLHEDGNIAQAPEQRAQTIDTIRNAGKHLLAVINDILDLSKIEADRMGVENIETPFIEILRETDSLMQSRAAAKGLTLTTTLVTPIPERIISDPTRLRQIVMNLAGNAIKFTEAGSVTISASIEQDEFGPRLLLDVIDTGQGMTQEQMSRVFAPFGQADNSVTRKYGGTGLGLTISRRLAGLMNGDVKVIRSTPGEGSFFRLILPLVAAPNSPVVTNLLSVKSTSESSATSVPITLKGSILLAEDGLDNQRLIAFHLKKAGAQVAIADNGRIALEMLDKAAAQGTPFDMLLTDMQMPEIDGYTLASTLRDRGSTLAIVALTAHAMSEDRAKCLGAGCDDYATKPIDKAKLLAVCAAWMGQRGGAEAVKRAA